MFIQNKTRSKLFIWLLSTIILFCCLPVSKIWAEEEVKLGTPTELKWKEGSTATATWENVPGANYYNVNVCVYQGENELVNTYTGTHTNEIDLQQQINSARSILALGENVEVCFKVQAVKIDENGVSDLTGEWSDFSSKLVYTLNEVVELINPSDIALTIEDDRYIARWTSVDHASVYYLYVTIDDECYSWEHISDSRNTFYSFPISAIYNEESGVSTCDVTEAIRESYIFNGYSGKNTQVSISIKSRVGWDEGNPDIAHFSDAMTESEPSNKIMYYSDETMLHVAENLSFTYNEDGRMIATWDEIEGATRYQVSFKVGDTSYIGYAGVSVFEPEIVNGKVVVDVTKEFLSDIYIMRGYNGQKIKASFCVEGENSFSGKGNYNYSEVSKWSNEVEYYNEVPYLKTPQNVTVSDDLQLTWDNFDENADYYTILIYYLHDDRLDGGRGADLFVTPCEDGKSASVDISEKIRITYNDYPNPVAVLIKLQATTYSSDDKNYDDSPYVDSNIFIYNPENKPVVENLTLSTDKMVMAVGKSYSFGVTIQPENAFYLDSRWKSDDEAIAEVNSEGRVTGMAPGNTVVTASIGVVSVSAEVSVYEVDTNITDEKEAEKVIEATEEIIDSIANGKDIDLGKTDIPQDLIEEIQAEIIEGAERGDTFHTDVEAIQQYFDTYKDNWGQIQKAADDLNAQFAGAYNIEVEMYHKDKNNEEHHIGNITELDGEITFTFDLPTGMKEQQSGKSKKYVLVRVHKNAEGKEEYEAIDYTVNDDGTFTAKSDKYSDFVWLSVGEDPTEDPTEDPVDLNGWVVTDGKQYWYEAGVKQGLEGRGKEIYDPSSAAWYWLDSDNNGQKAVSKDVFMESQADDNGTIGKWVRYDAQGHMIKGWCAGKGADAHIISSPADVATGESVYYFNPKYGTMAKGGVVINGIGYYFNLTTGVLEKNMTGWATTDGVDYWYENGIRQGFDGENAGYRGKEIYDPASGAWYWLDNVDGGKKATSKDVYQESLAGPWGATVNSNGERIGKWVRYDAQGHMIKGWCAGKDATAHVIGSPSEANGESVYYFDPKYGTMAKGSVEIDGNTYFFNVVTGILEP